MSIDVDPFILCLLQKQLQIFQIMSCHNNKRTFFHFHGYFSRPRISIGFCVCLIQQGHTLQIDLPHLQNYRKEFFHCIFIAHSEQCLTEKLIHFPVLVSQNSGMVGVCSHSPDSEKDQRFQGTDIFLGFPDFFHIKIIILTPGCPAAAALRHQSFFFFFHRFDLSLNSLIIKAYICHCGKQAFNEYFVSVFIWFCISSCSSGQSH